MSKSGVWYRHLGQHKSESSTVLVAPRPLTGAKLWLQNKGAGDTVLKAALKNAPKPKEKEKKVETAY